MKKASAVFLRKTILFVLLLIITGIANAQSWQDTVSMINKIFSRYSDNNPGAQIAISRNGQIIYSEARGMADLEHHTPLTKFSKIECGSVSKQFTAACILLLEQQGKLSLTDDIRKYVPEVPEYGNTITIRHIMNHVSGIKDWGSIAELGGWPRGTRAYNNMDALHIISLQKTLNNKPGDEYIYSNSGYNLLAIIVKRVSGMELAEFSKKNIFEPAGMKNTEWRDDYQRVVVNRSIAYSKSSIGYITNMPNENVYGNGGLLTTAEDLLAWNNYYLTGKLGSPSLLAKQITVTPFNNGKRHTYAAGLLVDSTNGWPSISHSGATAGYRANLEYFPDLGLSIAWVSNTAENEMSNIPSSVRNIMVKNIRKANPVTVPVKNDAPAFVATLSDYTSTYISGETESKMNIVARDGKLIIEQRNNEIILSPLAMKDHFSFLGGTLFFERDKKGKISKLYISISRARNVQFEKMN